MNSLEKDVLTRLKDDEITLQTFRKLFYLTVEQNKPKVEDADDELLGQRYRAYTTAIDLLDEVFNNLEDYRRVGKEGEPANRAI